MGVWDFEYSILYGYPFLFALQAAQRRMLADNTILFEDEAANLRWFLLPSEARALLLSPSSPSAPLVPSVSTYPKSPISPVRYPLSDCELSSRVDYVWEPEEETLKLGVGTVVGPKQRSEPAADSIGVRMCNKNIEDNVSLSRNSHRDPNGHKKEERSIKSSDGVGSAVRSEVLTVENSEMGHNIGKSDEERPEEPALPTLEKDTKLPSGKQTESSSKKKQKIVCEDLKCFVKREDGTDCGYGDGAGVSNSVCIIKKWHAPPKNIFNPTIEVRIY